MSITFNGDNDFIQKLREIVLAHMDEENFGVKELVQHTGLSAKVVRKRLKTILKKTINQFINEIRLSEALKILKKGSVTASEVAYKVGFSSPAYFSTCFHDYYGYPPGEAKIISELIAGNNQHSKKNKLISWISHFFNFNTPSIK